MRGEGAARRASIAFGPLVCTDLGVAQEWGVQASAGPARVTCHEAHAAAAWCGERAVDGGGWRLGLAASAAAPAAWDVGPTLEVLPMYATDAASARALDVPRLPGVRLAADPSADDVLAAYGWWMDDPGLARALLVPEDLRRTDRGFITAHEGADVLGCAFVWWAGGTGYLSGIGVRADRRGRGIGLALTAAAARLAAAGTAAWPSPDVVWMHATAQGAALYARMGFIHVDDLLHVRATPA